MAATPELEVDPRAAVDLCRSLLQAERTFPYREIKKAAERLGLNVTRRIYAAVQRELHRTVRLVDGEPEPVEPRKGGRTRDSAMAWMAGYLRQHPDASYRDVKEAGASQGHRVSPVTYGRARSMAGLPKKTQKTPAARRKSSTPARLPEETASTATSTTFIEDVIATIQRLEQERDRLRDAMDEILIVVRDLLAH